MIISTSMLAVLLVFGTAPSAARSGAQPVTSPSPAPSASAGAAAATAPPGLPPATAAPASPSPSTSSHPATAAPSAAPTVPTAPAVAAENPAVTVRAKAWYERLRKGSIDRAQLTSTLSTALTNDQVKAVAAQIGPAGTPVAFAYVTTARTDGYVRYEYELTFKDGSKLLYRFVLDGAGKIAGLFLQQAP